jgi:hypothetical protein
MPIRRSPNGAHHPHPQAGRDRPEWVVAINRNAWSQSIGIAGRDHPVCAVIPRKPDRKLERALLKQLSAEERMELGRRKKVKARAYWEAGDNYRKQLWGGW